jgi:hypothetical protein
MPKLMQVAESGAQHLRPIALGLLDRFRDLACVPILLKAAIENDPELARTGKTILARFGGKEVDADLLARLRLSSGKTRQVLIELAGQRRLSEALPVVKRSAEDSDAGVRRAAIEALGILGTETETSDLVNLLPAARGVGERDEIETALVSLCGRVGAASLPAVLLLARSSDTSLRIAAFHALGAMGGTEALNVVKAAIQDKDQTIQDEAVRALSHWPNTWPDEAGVAEPLLALARSGAKPAHQVQGLQGYLQYIQETKNLKDEQKLAQIAALQPITTTAEAKRMVISVLGALPTAGSMEHLVAFTQDETIAEEACLSILKIMTETRGRVGNTELRRQALQAVIDKSANDATRKRAEAALKRNR